MTEEWIAGMTGKQNGEELTVAMKFVKKGHRVVLLPEKEKGPDGNEMSALDMELDGIRMDIKTTTGTSAYGNFLVKKNTQLQRYNERPDIRGVKESSNLCIYFPNDNYDNDTMLRAIRYLKNEVIGKGESLQLKHLTILTPDKVINIDL